MKRAAQSHLHTYKYKGKGRAGREKGQTVPAAHTRTRGGQAGRVDGWVGELAVLGY